MKFTGERIVPHDPEQHDLYVEHLARYVFAEQWASNARILDVGCGCGYGTYHLAQQAIYAVGVDLAFEAVLYSAEHYRRPNLAYAAMDARCLAFPSQSFDLIVSFEFIEHVYEQEDVLAGVARALTDQGAFIVSTPNVEVYSTASGERNEYHARELTRAEFETLLRTFFHEVVVLGQHNTPEFTTHRYAHEYLRNLAESIDAHVQRIEALLNRPWLLLVRALMPPSFRARLSRRSKDRALGLSQVNSSPHRLPPLQIKTLTDIRFRADDLEEARFFVAVCKGPRGEPRG